MSEQKCIDQYVHMSLLWTLKLHKHLHMVPSWYESSIRDPAPGWYGEKSIPSLDQLIVCILCSKSSSAMCCCCKVFYMTPHLLSSQFLPKTNRDMLHSCWLTFFFLSSNQCWAVLTFLWEPAGSSLFMMLWEPDWFSNNFLWADENWSGYQYS
jgi:hypothetical protein